VEGKVPNVQTSVHLFVLDLAQRSQNEPAPRGGHGARKRVSDTPNTGSSH
jgi:hypothetical protein